MKVKTTKSKISKPKTSKKMSATKSDKVIIVTLEMPKITDEKRKELELKIDRARWKALTNDATVFYGQLMMNLRDELTYMIPTACTDGKVIKWNPAFLDKLTDENVLYVLIHETDHCALGHLWRFDFKDKKVAAKANQACDHVINLRLNSLSDIKIKMPEGGLADNKYKGMCEEEVYNLIPDDPGDNGEGEGDKIYGIGDFEDPKDGDGEGEGKEGEGKGGGSKKISLKEEWTRKIIQAAQACKSTSQGIMPAGIQRMIEEQMAHRVNWRDELSMFTKNCISMKNDYTRSCRRNAWYPVVMPRKKINNLSKMIWSRDCSGSVTNLQLGAFNSMIAQCMTDVGGFGWIFDHDAEVGKIYEINNESEIPTSSIGGGGTDFRPVFKKCQEMIDNGEDIAGIVLITDMFGSYPEPKDYPDYPVLWVSITKDQVGPFGKTVFVDGVLA